jgi:antitoxin (DNA-binding transcriptional repressor) of toxin-antitoxin stability system
MTIIVKVDEAKADLSDLLAKVEAGEDVILARGSDAIAKLTLIPRADDVATAIAEIRAARARATPVTVQEILEWRHDGHHH